MSNCAPASDLGRRVARRPPPWREAAVLGGLWAAVEIAAGSFLHNLRVPFAGMLLGATGVLLLVTGDQRWGGRGLMWRAGLICALIKSISPSAVILGPMIGIFTEGVLLEAAVRVLGRSRPGYWVGGALAVSWTLVQKILILLLTYGANIVVLYEEAYRLAARQLGMTGEGALELVLWVAVVSAIIGIAAAETGYRVGRAVEAPRVRAAVSPAPAATPAGPFPAVAVAKVIACLLLVAGGFAVLARAPLWAGMALVAVAAAGVSWRTPGVRRRVGRARMWLELGLLVLVSAWLLGAVRGSWTQGLHAGGAMVIRAAWVMVGFGLLGATLRDSALAAWLRGGRLAEPCANLDAAVSALPVFATALADRRARWREPRAVLLELLHVADQVLVGRPEAAQVIGGSTAAILVLLTGDRGGGKTTRLAQVAAEARAHGLQVGGILQHAVWDGDARAGYDVEDLATGRRVPLCRVWTSTGPMVTGTQAGPFVFRPRGLAFGRRAIRRAIGADVAIVDEVGLLEVGGRGWAPALDALTASRRGPMIWAVRLGVEDVVAGRWGSASSLCLEVSAVTATDLTDALKLSRISGGGPVSADAAARRAQTAIGPATEVRDRYDRPLRKLRLSLTDRCNLRCAYCLSDRPDWLPSDRFLTSDEIVELVTAFAACGVSAVRLTGGEPLVRRDLPEIVRRVSDVPGVADLSLTTNGVLLADRVDALAEAGLRRINISLDTLRSSCFAELAGRDAHASVLRGIEAAARVFARVKLNAVVIRGVNDDELADLVAFGRSVGAEIRFIEFMDVTAGWSLERVVPRQEILARIEARFGPAAPLASGSDPAERFRLSDRTTFGIVPSVSAPFCGSCDRTRVSAAGVWYRCLYAAHGVDLRADLRAGGSAAVVDAIRSAWRDRDDRGAEARAAGRATRMLPLVLSQPPGGIGMHARGG